MWWIITILLLLFLILPLPIKLNLEYSNGKIILKIYNKVLDFKKNNKVKKPQHKTSQKPPKNNINNFKNIYSSLKENHLKPTLNIEFSGMYNLNDAAATAISYGLMCSISPFIYHVLSQIFTVKKFKFKIVPEFNKNITNIEINSIIFINIVKIIYIMIKVFKEMQLNKKH